MRSSLWFVLSVFLLALGAPNAHADSFTPIFNCTPPLCTSAPNAPAVTFPAPTTINETWDGVSATLTLVAPDAPTDTYTFVNFVGGPDTLEFDILDDTTREVATSLQPSDIVDHADGLLTFAPVATPETGTAVLMLLGIGLVLVLGIRRAQIRPLTN